MGNLVITKPGVTFTFTPRGRIYFETRYQRFLIVHTKHPQRLMIQQIWFEIERGKIHDFNSLAESCGDELKWVQTGMRSDLC